MTKEKRKIIGAILWWTEGTKSARDKRWKNAVSYPIEVTNTNPEVIRLFLNFLRKDIRIDEKRLKVQIQIHEDNNLKECLNFWSKIADVKKEQFNKTIVRPLGKKIGKTKGTCKIRYMDKKAYFKLTRILESVLSGA